LPRSRGLRIGLLVGPLLVLLGSVAAAFTAAPGFSATTYATGFVSGSPAGTAFVGASIYAVDPTDGWLYRGTGTAPITVQRVAQLGSSPMGLTTFGGSLYVTRQNDVVKVDPATGIILATVATSNDIPCPRAIAAGPVADPALYVSSCGAQRPGGFPGATVWRIDTPAVAPVITPYATNVPQPSTAYGIAVSSDDTIYVALTAQDQIWSIQGPIPAGGGPPFKAPAITTNAPKGIGITGDFVLVNHLDGTITKHSLSSGDAVVALTGGASGDLASIGTDGCFYASQGTAVIRLANTTGTCDFTVAAPPPPPPSLVLTNTSTTTALIGGSSQVFTATLMNATNPSGLVVTFTVTGTNAMTRDVTVLSNFTSAEFQYNATRIGADTVVVATTIFNGQRLTSNPVTVTWSNMISAQASTPAGNYTFGTVTNLPVTVTFTCASPAGVKICPVPQTFSTEGTFAVTATATDNGFVAGVCPAPPCNDNIVTQTFGTVIVDLTQPSVTPSIGFNTQGTVVTLDATDNIGVASITFSATGAQTIAPVTIAGAHTSFVINAIGSTEVVFFATDVAGSRSVETHLMITTQPSTLTITSEPVIATGGAVSAQLLGPGGVPIVGKTVTFSAGGSSANAVTNSNGVASATLGLGPGPTTLAATFAGNASFFGSSATGSLIVAQPTRFVIWGGNTGGLHPGDRVQFWGAQWAKQVTSGDYRAGDDFKGWAQTASGATWSSKGGSSDPPASVASYITVIVTTHVSKSGGTVTGDVARIAVLRVESPGTYDGKVGHPGYGTIIAHL